MAAEKEAPPPGPLGPLARYGGDRSALGAAQGELFTETYESGKS